MKSSDRAMLQQGKTILWDFFLVPGPWDGSHAIRCEKVFPIANTQFAFHPDIGPCDMKGFLTLSTLA